MKDNIKNKLEAQSIKVSGPKIWKDLTFIQGVGGRYIGKLPQEFFEVHFLYKNGKGAPKTDLNLQLNKFDTNLAVKIYLRFLINDYWSFLEKVSRVFVFKYKNGKKTWSKVFHIDDQEFYDYVNSRTKQEKKLEDMFYKPNNIEHYCEVLKKLGKE